MRAAFSRCHPVVELCYFALVLGLGMFCTNPVCVGLSLVSALACNACLGTGRSPLHLLILPMALLTMVMNPLFSHAGATILTYLPGGNPLTLESICFGLGSGVMLAGVILWFSLLNRVMTSDKFVYLFGRVIPALSLVLSMALGFVPRFLSQSERISSAQRQMSDAGRVRGALRRFSILVSWSLEGALDTADSMRSRGYGLRGRRAFSIYRWSLRDALLLIWLLGAGAYVLLGLRAVAWSYYPVMTGLSAGAYPVSVYAVYAALCLTPAAYGLWEDYRWRSLQSGI